MLGTMPFQSIENALFDIKKELQKGHFRSFGEKGRAPDPETPLVARMISSYLSMNQILHPLLVSATTTSLHILK